MNEDSKNVHLASSISIYTYCIHCSNQIREAATFYPQYVRSLHEIISKHFSEFFRQASHPSERGKGSNDVHFEYWHAQCDPLLESWTSLTYDTNPTILTVCALLATLSPRGYNTAVVSSINEARLYDNPPPPQTVAK